MTGCQYKPKTGVLSCGKVCDPGEAYCPRCKMMLAAIEKNKHEREQKRRIASVPFQTRARLLAAGYKFENKAVCSGCHQPIEFWTTPNLRRAPFDPMAGDHDRAVTHFATCAEAAKFRRRA